MKKFFLLTASALVSAFAFAIEPTYGSGTPGIAVIKKDESTFNLFYKPVSSTNVRVSILNEDGSEVFSESLKSKDGFVRPYNFSHLAEGKYTITVEGQDESHSQSIIYKHSVVPKAANVVKMMDDKYLVSIRGDMVDGKVKVNIYNGSKLIHQTESDVNGDFAQVYNLQKVKEPVTFEILDSRGHVIN